MTSRLCSLHIKSCLLEERQAKLHFSERILKIVGCFPSELLCLCNLPPAADEGKITQNAAGVPRVDQSSEL